MQTNLLLPQGVNEFKLLRNNHTKSDESHQLRSFEKLLWKFSENYQKIILDKAHAEMNMSSVANAFVGILQKYWEQLF